MVTGDTGTLSGLALIIPSSNIGKNVQLLVKQRLTCIIYTVFMHELRSGVCRTGSNILKWYDLNISLWPQYLAAAWARRVVSKSMFILGSPGTRAGHFTSVFTSIISLANAATNTTSAAYFEVITFKHSNTYRLLVTHEGLMYWWQCNVYIMSLPIVARNVCDMTFVSLSIILVDGIPPGVTVPNPRS